VEVTDNRILVAPLFKNEFAVVQPHRKSCVSRQTFTWHAGFEAGAIRHLSAHFTSTPACDLSELEAIKAVFGR
jgi:hypothetical protein